MWMAVQRAWRSTGWSRFAGLGGLDEDRSLAAWHRGETVAFGRPVRIDLWAGGPDEARTALGAAESTLARLAALWHVGHADTELARVNGWAARRAVPVRTETFALLARALAFSRASGGAFDVTCGGPAAEPAEARPTGWHRVLLDARDRTVRFEKPGLRLDPAGFARGLALDEVGLALRSAGIRHAVIRCGRSARLVGDRRGEPWTVALGETDPAGRPGPVLSLTDRALATWGTLSPASDRPALGAGHGAEVVDPRDGRPARRVRGVAVVSDDLALADALAVVLRVRGATEGLALVDAVPDCDALVVDADGRMHASRGLAHVADVAH